MIRLEAFTKDVGVSLMSRGKKDLECSLLCVRVTRSDYNGHPPDPSHPLSSLQFRGYHKKCKSSCLGSCGCAEGSSFEWC